MKLILSRKGFDSAAGGVASPILPGGELRSLPIPDVHSPIRYADIRSAATDGLGDDGDNPRTAQLVQALTGGRLRGRSRAHLDPDLLAVTLPREPGWRPLFGQCGAAQGHLARQAVGAGDLFLFFGWFRAVERRARRWRYTAAAPDLHLLHGWLQIGAVVDLATAPPPSWARYHPHCHGRRGRGNRLYLAAERLRIDGRDSGLPGAGVFSHFAAPLKLSAGGARRSLWRLPVAFHPDRRVAADGADRAPLSYHERAGRWRRDGEHCWLEAAHRGQEFVLDLRDYADLLPWLSELFACATPGVASAQDRPRGDGQSSGGDHTER